MVRRPRRRRMVKIRYAKSEMSEYKGIFSGLESVLKIRELQN